MARSVIAGAVAAFVLSAAPGAVCISVSAATAGPSFDCARASEPSEYKICATASLAALDRRLAAAYRARLAREPAIKLQQKGWLLARDAGCGAEAECLSAFIGARLKWMSGTAPMATRKPHRLGECSLTTLKEKTNRFEGEPGSGSAAVYANGGYQVSYDTEAGIEHAAVGDPVVFCLAFIPDECPPGDNRGWGYASGDLRTLEGWSLSESEHSCGGA